MVVRRQPRIVIVTRETRLEGLLERWVTRNQARFAFRQAKAVSLVQAGNIQRAALVQSGADTECMLDFEEIVAEEDTYKQSLGRLRSELDFDLPVQVVNRDMLPTLDFESCSVVVVAGPDGLVANTAKYVGTVPIVGVNPDPKRIDGVLLPFQVPDARPVVARVLAGRARIQDVSLAQATLHDGQKLLAFNDFFIGKSDHTSARYELHVGDLSENQCSSGILVSTGAGSTGWMSSVLNMARGIAAAWGEPVPLSSPGLARDARALMWAVREPFHSVTSGTRLVAGRLGEGNELVVHSQMSAEGTIFSDGIMADFLPFPGGSVVRVGLAQERARLVIE